MIIDIAPKTVRSNFGHIENSTPVPLSKFGQRYKSLPKTKTIVLYDYNGQQTLMAARYLKHKGFNRIKVLQGGLLSWFHLGYPFISSLD